LSFFILGSFASQPACEIHAVASRIESCLSSN
jgi:hypothetical protein